MLQWKHVNHVEAHSSFYNSSRCYHNLSLVFCSWPKLDLSLIVKLKCCSVVVVLSLQGVIFDIDIDYTNQLLCSVSDDRSIHLWRWEYQAGAEISWANTDFQLSMVFNGHTSRVWSASILSSETIVSIGEVRYGCSSRSNLKCWFFY